ncbi:LysR family transcriptional regulator [Saccharobesus litoralis]|uniref:LysR family transcriptional regulator n=2 Tax=Saccharobesus litoralis TaxID=2172099 RepID=A0A2S0VSQ4_9ALTE|nr:LysR family transcriptional regulator [Saccharobesus litoralis]
MDVQQLHIFVEVVNAGSFAKAARILDRDPSLISRSIASLEAHLGVRLFQRSTRVLSLTDSGARYLARIKPILDALSEAEDELRVESGKVSGRVTLTASVAFGQMCLLPLMAELMATFPLIDLDLKLTDSNLDLLEENIDLAIRLTPAFESDLIGYKLFNTHYKVVASPEYLNNHSSIQSPDDLEHHKCLVFSMAQYRTAWMFINNDGQQTKININSQLALSSALALKECTKQGLGVCLLADWLIKDEIKQGNLVDVLPEYKVTATDFHTAAWLLYPSRHYVPNRVRAVIEFLKNKLADNNFI